MSDDLIKDKMWGQGHNYQKKAGFPQGLLSCFEPPAVSGMRDAPEAMAAYKPTAAAGGTRSKDGY